MEISQTTGAIVTPQAAVNMKGNAQGNIETSEKDPKESLTNPMETVGRSQVQFRGTLSSKDLNRLSESVSRLQMTNADVTTMKKALANTLKKHNFANIDELHKKYSNDMDASLDFLQDFLAEATKINPKADIDKIGLIVGTLY